MPNMKICGDLFHSCGKYIFKYLSVINNVLLSCHYYIMTPEKFWFPVTLSFRASNGFIRLHKLTLTLVLVMLFSCKTEIIDDINAWVYDIISYVNLILSINTTTLYFMADFKPWKPTFVKGNYRYITLVSNLCSLLKSYIKCNGSDHNHVSHYCRFICSMTALLHAKFFNVKKFECSYNRYLYLSGHIFIMNKRYK